MSVDFLDLSRCHTGAGVDFLKGEATCYGPIAENIHAANERVNIESVVHTAKVYALFLARWCGLAE